MADSEIGGHGGGVEEQLSHIDVQRRAAEYRVRRAAKRLSEACGARPGRQWHADRLNHGRHGVPLPPGHPDLPEHADCCPGIPCAKMQARWRNAKRYQGVAAVTDGGGGATLDTTGGAAPGHTLDTERPNPPLCPPLLVLPGAQGSITNLVLPRPTHNYRDAAVRARELSPTAIERIAEIMLSPDPRVALQAAALILDRAYGKPAAQKMAPANDLSHLPPEERIRLMRMALKAEMEALERAQGVPEKTAMLVRALEEVRGEAAGASVIDTEGEEVG